MKISKKYTLLTLFILVMIVLIFAASNVRLMKTLYLIAQVSPYEQVVPGAPSILVLGDSTGYGTGADTKEDSVAGRMGADFSGYTIINDSKNGRTINELVPVVAGLTGQYALILLQIGSNDILSKRPIDTVEMELRTIIQQLAGHTNHVVMMSSGNVGGAVMFSPVEAEKFEAYTRDFRAMFFAVQADTIMTYVDLFLEPEDDFFTQEPKVYTSWDELHPSSQGYAEWYKRLYPVLIYLLR